MACTCKPGKTLCRSCLNNQATPYIGNTVNDNGEFTIHQVAVFQKEFEANIANDLRTNALSRFATKYGTTFYESVNNINNDFMKREATVNALSKTDGTLDVISFRVAKGPLTAVEIAAFYESSNYTPATAIVSSNANGSRFLKELDDFYNGDFSVSVMGGFCALFDNIFGVINGFFDLIGSVQGLIDDALSLINKIKNIESLVKAAFEKIKVKALLEAIKKKIKDMIEKTIAAVCRSISNFNVGAIVGPGYKSPVQLKIVADVEEKKTALSQLCGPEEAKRITDKIDTLINYATGLFENPSIEEIMFLISRLCGLATGIEGLFKGLKDPLKDFTNRYDEVFNTLSNASNRVTGEAIRAGAIREAEEYRQRQINKARDEWEAAGNVALPSIEEYTDLPKWDDLESGSDARLKIQGGWVTRMTPAREGWDLIPIDVKVLLMRLQKEANNAGIVTGPLRLNSGYRNPEYNEKVGGAKASQHLSGNAVDLTWSGFNPYDVGEFVQLARRIGFKGVGYYNTFVHVDVGALRQWDKRGGSGAQ